MVLKNRLDYGFNGYQVPPTPRAARSARRRCSFKKKLNNDQQMCAFDLLATVAGKLLLDGGEKSSPHSAEDDGKDHPSASDIIRKEEKEAEDDDKPLEEEKSRDCFERIFLFTDLVSGGPPNNQNTGDAQNDVVSRPASGITTSDCSEKVGTAELLANDDCKLRLGIFTPSLDVDSCRFRLSANNSEDESRKKDILNTELPEGSDRKCSVDSVKFTFSAPFDGGNNKSNNNVKLVTRDDDEKYSSECARNKEFKAPIRVGEYHRFRKVIATKHCKVASNRKDGEWYNAEKCSYLDRKNNLKRQRSLRDYPFKKRKLYACGGSESNTDEGNSSEGTRNGGNEGVPTLQRVAPNHPASVAGGYVSFHSRNPQVKLKIKSFRVPELFIEIPETATVGSLKRTVVEAVNSVLGGGIRVGVVLQGKKIRDDNKTLLQAGISHDNKMDTLGFTLEPNPNPGPIKMYPEDRPGPRLSDNPQPLARYPPTPIITQNAAPLDIPPDHHLPAGTNNNLNNFIESDHDSAPSPPAISSLQRTTSESKALVPVPSTKPDALAVVPLRKSKQSESAQRRIRRPFTVAEVEALVQAVEKLGTGRWRDVKLRAFDSAKHRTYVDLKDKWKTLVHTARISPQQRRGEPVPQELLDRVLTAHAYWSQQQAKQQLKTQPDTCLLL